MVTSTIASSIFAASAKKVLLLDFKNILNKKGYQYLEPTITDAVRKRLKQKFAFKELAKEKWQALAKKNYIRESELYTFTAANSLGLLARQDVAIFGGFYIEETKNKKKKASAKTYIITRVRIVDLSKRKEIADFQMKSAADATIFDSVNKIADRIVKEASVILPNKDAWQKGELEEDVPTVNQVSLRAGMTPLALKSQSRLLYENSEHDASDVNNVIALALDFQHFGLFTENLGVFVDGGVRLGQDNFQYRINRDKVPVRLLGFSGAGGFSWRYNFNETFYLQPLLGGGVHYDTIKFSFDNTTIATTSASGQLLNLTELTTLAPFARSSLRFGYKANDWLLFELDFNFEVSFYKATSSSMATSFNLGVGFIL